MSDSSFRKVKRNASDNNTWLAPYVGYIVEIIKLKNGRIDLKIDGSYFANAQGYYISSNGWKYTLLKLLTKPNKCYARH